MEAEENPQTTSLFPVLHHRPSLPAAPTGTGTGNSPAVPRWLSNSSFTTDLSLINDAVSSHYTTTTALQSPSDDVDVEVDVDVEGDDRKPTYDLVDSSASDRVSSDSGNDDDERARKKRRKDKKKKRKRKRRERSTEAPGVYDYSFSRKSDVRHWASSSTSTPTDNDYYFDSRGDPDNLAFGCIYRMDIARYKLFNSTKDSEHNYRALFHWSGKRLVFDGDGDFDGLDAKIRSGGRYWSAKYAALERHKNLKRLRICAPRRYTMNGMVDDFIPLSDEASDAGSVTVVEESWEDKVLRKTREFNGMTREHPHDEKIWVAFAEFQDKVASMQPQKGARLQTLERKISILEKATELNPDNEDLLLALMNGYHSRDNTDALIGRWEKLLMLHSGSCKLWREFLHVIQGEFSRFKVSEVRKMYANAIQALSAACSKLRRQVHDLTKTSVDPYVVEQELGLVDIFICLCRFEWQAGYQELATALFQAELEYSLFCPDLLLTEQSKQRLFEHFWNSSGARVGEDGAVGWSTWLGKEEEQRQKLVNEDSSDKVEEGGWTGWFEPLSKGKDISSNLDSDLAVGQFGDKMDDEQEDDTETRNKEQEDDTEALLKMLGIDADAAANSEIKDTKTWTRWSEEELSRDSNQWMPARVASSQSSHVHSTTEEDGDEQLVRVVLFEDVSEFLFSIVSDAARLSLVSQIVDFYGGKIAHWTCTNSSSWAEKTLSLEDLPASLLDDIKGVNGASRKTDPIPSSSSLEVLLHSSADTSMQIGMMKFLRNAILLCLPAFPENYLLEEAALVAEELVNTRMNSCSFMVTPCRALAKSLLKSNRQDVLLCAVYARREAFFGNMDHARKVFDMAISSTDGLPSDSRTNLYILYFWYAEVELANGSGGGSDSSMRAMHILSCLGSGTKYSTFKGQLSSLQQLRARQGFKERVKLLQSKWARGFVDDQSVALVCAAALFEELAAGWVAGVEILNEAFSMVLPERRRQSYHLEFLFNYYLCMLERHLGDLKLSKVWDSVVDRLQIYPNSPKLYNSLLQIGHLYTSPNKLRRIFDDYCQKRPSVIVWLFALSFEMSRGGSKHRIHALFERALANDKLHNSVVLWRCYISYEMNVSGNSSAARRIFFRAINACPWSKKLWLDGFLKLNSVLTVKELSDLQEVMRDKELNLRTDIYEILLQDEMEG